MRSAIVENGVVVNCVLLDDLSQLEGAVECPEHIGVGMPIDAPAPPSPTLEQTIADYEAALDRHLDSVAQAYTFKDRHSLALRAAYPNPWQALGQAFGSWMDGCNDLAYVGMQEVIAGTRPLPTLETFIDSLPQFSV